MDEAGQRALQSLKHKSPQIGTLIDLFLSRITIINSGDHSRAEIDRGFWKNYGDSGYALYNGTQSPISCSVDAFNMPKKTLAVARDESFIDANLGWDISHGRRLVPALQTLTRNRAKLQIVFGYAKPALDPARLTSAFANQIVLELWNKDRQFPLFANFWDGANGWYRAGYENGTSACRPGEPPYGLAWSLPTGGYLAWGAVNPDIQSLGLRFLALAHSDDAASVSFMQKYYPQLVRDNPAAPVKAIWNLTLTSAMVH